MNEFQEYGFLFLDRIIEVLQNQGIKAYKGSDDGRYNSTKDEIVIVGQIKAIVAADDNVLKGVEFIDVPPRHWFDFGLCWDQKLFPVNIKSTTMGSDNLNCKSGLYYALTGCEPKFDNQIPFDKFHEELGGMIDFKSDKEYFFLVVYKEDTSNILVNSLRCIESLIPNGNNLPFQCCWSKNKNRISIKSPEDLNKLLNVYAKSLRLRADAYLSFEKYVLNRIKYDG